MKVIIKNKQIVIDNNVLEYDPFYFAIWNRDIDYRLTVKKTLEQWASALKTLKEMDVVYLPYNLEDQLSGFMKASLDGRNVVLTDVLASANGYAMDLDNLSKYIYGNLKLKEILVDGFGQKHKVTPKFTLHLDKQELINSLREAEIAKEV